MKSNLLASAGTLQNIEGLINRFYCSDSYRVNPETLAIEHPSGRVPWGVRVVKKGRRYRFEMVPGEC